MTENNIKTVNVETNPTAKEYQTLAADFLHAKEIEHEKALHKIVDHHKQQIDELTHQHLEDASWKVMLQQAREAAEKGGKECMILRFPNNLCGDGGRAINVGENGWPQTLHGEAAEIYSRWEQDLKPQGFHLSARTLEYPGGFPGDIGLFLGWGY